jgi:hypothetical protein
MRAAAAGAAPDWRPSRRPPIAARAQEGRWGPRPSSAQPPHARALCPACRASRSWAGWSGVGGIRGWHSSRLSISSELEFEKMICRPGGRGAPTCPDTPKTRQGPPRAPAGGPHGRSARLRGARPAGCMGVRDWASPSRPSPGDSDWTGPVQAWAKAPPPKGRREGLHSRAAWPTHSNCPAAPACAAGALRAEWWTGAGPRPTPSRPPLPRRPTSPSFPLIPR